MYGIIGSGFGIYGYLPAIVLELDRSVLLLEKSRSTVESRPELVEYLKKVVWTNTVDELINRSTGIILAVPPESQAKIVREIIAKKNLREIVLEKPLSPTPRESRIILDRFYETNKPFRIGYTFLHTDWFEQSVLNAKSKNAKLLFITWKFKAHHFRTSCDTWKRYHSKGGGVISFYSIHLFATLAVLGYTNVDSAIVVEGAIDQPNALYTTYSGKDLPKCQVLVDTNSDRTIFETSLMLENGEIAYSYRQAGPFICSGAEGDIRINVLRKILSSFSQHDNLIVSRSQNYQVIRLWEQVTDHYRR